MKGGFKFKDPLIFTLTGARWFRNSAWDHLTFVVRADRLWSNPYDADSYTDNGGKRK